MTIIAECGKRIMAVENAEGVDELTKCRVYNAMTGKLAPELPVGSWTARVFPWIKPTREYRDELAKIEAIVKAEKKNK